MNLIQFRKAQPVLGGKLAGLLLASALVLGGGGVSAQVYNYTTFLGVAGVTGTNDGTRGAAQFNQVTGVVVDGAGNLILTDETSSTIRVATANGVVTTLAGSAGNWGTNDGTGTNALFDQPTNLTVDKDGNMYVADTFNHTIRKVTPQGVVTTIAGVGGSPGFQNGTGAGAMFNQPNSVAMDINGAFMYVADGANNCIRKVTTTGVVTTPAGTTTAGTNNGTGATARFNFPEAVAVDGSGMVYVADAGNNAIRVMTPGGTVSTLAGLPGPSNIGSKDGTGTGARFSFPECVAVDGSSNVFVADYGNNTIRKITPAGVVTTIGGKAGVTGSADGTNSSARFNGEEGIAVDKSGNLYIADTVNNTIRIGIAPVPAVLEIAHAVTNTVVTWTNSAFSLQSAPQAGGTYSDVAAAVNPYTNTAGGGQQFYRLKAN